MLTLIWTFLFLSQQQAYAAWPDSSEGRIYAVQLFRRDFNTPGNILMGDDRTNSYEKACELKYYQACHYEKWTDDRGLSDLQLAGDFLGKRCKSDALACVVSGWAKGYVNGKPSAKAPNTRQAIKDLEWGCKKKAYAPSCAHLGEMHMLGVGTKTDYKKAQSLFKEACKAKDQYGCFIEGDLYYNGWGVEQNYLEANKRFSKGCDQGYTQACVRMARMHERGQGVARDYEKAIDFYGKACTAKDGDGCFNLARMYAGGLGVENSAPLAFAMYNTLCSAGDQKGCYGVASLYELGRGVERDLDTAQTLYQQACREEYAPACSQMGTMLINIPDLADPVAGLGFVKKGCEMGDPKGCVQLGALYLDGSAGEKNLEKAKAIFEDTCGQKMGLGCYQLGLMFDRGEGVEKDPNKALKLYEEGCDLLSGPSCGIIGHRYLKGFGGVMKSSNEAVRYFEMGCEHGDQRSCREMADFYYEGKLVSQDTVQALRLYKQSCELFNAGACLKVGELIVGGAAGEPNYSDALRAFEAGCKMGNEESCAASSPIMFQGRYEQIMENAFKSARCEVWTYYEDRPDKNAQVVRVNKNQFSVMGGEYKDQIFTVSHQTTTYSENGPIKVAQSMWEAKSDQKTFAVEHHENWAYKRVKASQFPGDESFSRDPKGSESVYYSRENETMRRNTAKRCKYVDGAKILTGEHCSEVQALIASRLVTKCR